MSLLLILLLAFLIGFVEWWIALRRTVALVNGERTLVFMLVLVEGLLAWGVLFSFLSVPTYPVDASAGMDIINLIKAYQCKIMVAISASVGGAVGSLLVKSKRN